MDFQEIKKGAPHIQATSRSPALLGLNTQIPVPESEISGCV